MDLSRDDVPALPETQEEWQRQLRTDWAAFRDAVGAASTLDGQALRDQLTLAIARLFLELAGKPPLEPETLEHLEREVPEVNWRSWLGIDCACTLCGETATAAAQLCASCADRAEVAP